MSNIRVTFDSNQDIELVAKEVVSNQPAVDVRFLITERDADDNYLVQARLANARVPLQKCLFNHQDELKSILDSADTHENKVQSIVKAAVQYGAGVGYNV